MTLDSDFRLTAAEFEAEVRRREDLDDDALESIRAKEREFCAQLVESFLVRVEKPGQAREFGLGELAKLIRARGENK